MISVDLIVGARPNFMKAAPILRLAEERSGITFRLVHTGQHYDHSMNEAFFQDLGLRSPDISLGVGSCSHAQQVAKIMVEYEQAVLLKAPSATMVIGDVNSTIAAALVATKLNIPVVHLEAGLRSNDFAMPEEINRLATDAISKLLLTPSRDASENLIREGVSKDRIRFVGNLMIDTLHFQLSNARGRPLLRNIGLEQGGVVRPYVLVTLHRPSNVDEPAMLANLVEMLAALGKEVPVLFPIHPRTKARLSEGGLKGNFAAFLSESNEPIPKHGLVGLPPLGYNDFLLLMDKATVVLTDSGGVQEETTVLGKPCLTLRENTERPVTVLEGTNTIVGSDLELTLRLAREALAGKGKKGTAPEGWDGHAAGRTLDALEHFFNS